MPFFRKKPVVIEAQQLGSYGTPASEWDAIAAWAGGHRDVVRDGAGRALRDCLIIPTLEGDHRAEAGDWIVKGVKGEFYPVKPDIFAATYEPVGVPKEGNNV